MESLTAFAAVQGVESWPDLPTQSLPDFPVDALPDDAAEYCKALSASLQVAPDMVACFMLGVASAASVGRISVKPLRNRQYIEPIQLFLICRGNSGERKTPTLASISEPLRELISVQAKDIQDSNKPVLREIEVWEAKRKRCKENEVLEIHEQIDRLQAALKPDPVRILGDITVEAITRYMASHDGKAIIMTDEPNFLHVSTGKSYTPDKKAVNLDAILSGYSGGYAAGMRVGGGEWTIDKAALSVCVATQPNVLDEFVSDPASTGRGLQGRFLYFLPVSKVGQRSLLSPEVPEDSKRWWTQTVRRIAKLPDCTVIFDNVAEQHYADWWSSTECRLCGDLDGSILEWSAKLCGNTVRIAGLIALMDQSYVVQSVHWDAAQTIAETYLIPCAKILFCGGDDRLSPDARLLLERIAREQSFSEADLWRQRGRHLLKNDRQRFRVALQNLQLAGYMRAESMRNISNGKETICWTMNPNLRKKADKMEEVIWL